MSILLVLMLSLSSLYAWSDDDRVLTFLMKLHEAPEGLIALNPQAGSPVLLVQGIDPTEKSDEWVKPLRRILSLEKSIYFHKWSKHKSMRKNQELLVESIKGLLSKYKNEELNIIAYSAGGAIALLAKDALSGSELDERVKLHTVASPIFGYGAPAISSYLAAPFVGYTTIALGVGINKKIKNNHLLQCTHWVNTNCDMDHHACPRSRGVRPQYSEVMPCGLENTQYFDDEDHYSILSKVIERIDL